MALPRIEEPRRVLPRFRGWARKFSSFLRFQRYRVEDTIIPERIVALDGTGDFDNIQSAIDDLPAQGGDILIKAGIYTITKSILIDKNNVTLYGVGGKGTKIQTTANIRMIDIGRNAEVTNVSIQNLYIYGAGTGNALNNGIYVTSCTDLKILYNIIENCAVNGITVAHVGSNFNLIANNFCNSNFLSGIFVAEGDDNKILMNICNNNGLDGITLGKFTATSNRNIIRGSTCKENGAYGVRIQSGNIANVITFNILIGNASGNILDNGTETQIGHNIEQ